MSTIFSKIVAGDIPCYKIAENELFFAFLDIEPLNIGHILIVPKIEVDKAYDAPDEYLSQWLLFAKPIAKALEQVVDCKRVGISFIGLEVPHAHMHLVPINTIQDMNFSQKPQSPSALKMLDIQSSILRALASIMNEN
jgi:histidine triad (HIT) family protein